MAGFKQALRLNWAPQSLRSCPQGAPSGLGRPGAGLVWAPQSLRSCPQGAQAGLGRPGAGLVLFWACHLPTFRNDCFVAGALPA